MSLFDSWWKLLRTLWGALFGPRDGVPTHSTLEPPPPTTVPDNVIVFEPPTVTTFEPEPPPSLPVLSIPAGSRFMRTPDGDVVDYREATAMGLYRLWLDGDVEQVDEMLSYFRERKINAIRPLFNLDSDHWRLSLGRGNTHLEGEEWWAALRPFIDHVATYEIYTRCCLFGGIEAFVGHQLDWTRRPDVVSAHPEVIAKMHEYVERFVAVTSDAPSVLYEVANEPAQIGFGSDSGVVVSLGCRIKDLAPERVMNFGAACDEDSTFYAKPPADFLDEHLRRNVAWDYQAAIKRLIHHAAIDQPMAFCSGEWMNLGTVTRPGRGNADGTPSTATAFASAAMLRLKRCLPSFHAACLLSPTLPDEITDRALVAWSDALDRIPIEFPGVGLNGHWPSSPFDASIFPPTEEAQDGWDGPIRIYGLDGAEGYLGITIREPAGYRLVGAHRDIETVRIAQWGEWQSRIVRARA